MNPNPTPHQTETPRPFPHPLKLHERSDGSIYLVSSATGELEAGMEGPFVAFDCCCERNRAAYIVEACNAYPAIVSALAEARKALEEAQKDKERMDWLESKTIYMTRPILHSTGFEDTTLRSAIDAALPSAPKTGERK